MGQDMSTYWLAPVCTGEESTGAGIGLDLVRLGETLHQLRLLSWPITLNAVAYHENADIELLSHTCKLAQELIELLLPVCEFSTATIVDAETGHDAIDY